MNANTGNQPEKQEPKHEDEQQRKSNLPEDIVHPTPAHHNDDARSRMPERGDKHRDQSPADRPGKKPGEGEPPVG